MEPESLPPIRAKSCCVAEAIRLVPVCMAPPCAARGNARWTRELHRCVRTLVWSIDAPGQEGIRASNTDKGPEGA